MTTNSFVPAAPIAELIRSRRHSYSLAEMAKLTGYSVQEIERFQRCAYDRMRFYTADKICCALGMPLACVMPEAFA